MKKIIILKIQTIDDFTENHANSQKGFDEWQTKIKVAQWEIPEDIKGTFPSSSKIGTDRVKFNIAGNNYRMICSFKVGNYAIRLWIKWLGTHAEYDKLCEKGEQFTVDDY